MEFTYLEFGMIIGLCAFSFWLGGVCALNRFDRQFINRNRGERKVNR